ncbi:MAG TPA: hypothetical protein VFL57_17365, partial [Bryobacteraceae bacterium]|nr:hypothetical protein [Bryobacteraceae bacterium]
MFEFLFGHPASLFARAKLVFLSGWPVWVLIVSLLVIAVLLFLPFWRMRSRGSQVSLRRSAVLWGLQAAFIGVLLM